jgi:hypothetical protein
MNRKTLRWAAALSALVFIGVVRAHHSSGMFDIAKPVWVKGTVLRYEPINPHALIALEERTPGRPAKRWVVEGQSLNGLKRYGIGEGFLKAGDVIEVCGFAFREDLPGPTSSATANGPARPSLHGHVLVMPDGKMRLFGPYGKLVNCVASRSPARVPGPGRGGQ